MKKILTIFISFFLFTAYLHSQNDAWKISGQVQLRSELDGRDFSHKTYPLTFASLRTRLSVEKTFMDKINFFVQIQDSRIFGEEGNTLAAIDNIDLHQGYVTLKQLFDWDMDVQAGRFEVAYGTERFFGAVGWHYVGRSWDGVRFKFYPGFKLDLFALTHTETNTYIANATSNLYPLPAPSRPSFSVYGFWESANLNEQNQLDVFGYYEINRMKIPETDNNTIDRFTLGLNHFGNYSNFSTIAEAAYQFGSIGFFDLSAYLVSLQASYKTECMKLGAGADIISGTGSTFSNNTFNHFTPAFGTNHKFYGYMDYFINFPNNTFAAGLNDFYLNLSLLPPDSKWNASLDIHNFSTNKSIMITSIESPAGTEEFLFGQEIDLTVRYSFIKGTTLTWGGSAFVPGEIMRGFFGGRSDVGLWSYLMITANIN